MTFHDWRNTTSGEEAADTGFMGYEPALRNHIFIERMRRAYRAGQLDGGKPPLIDPEPRGLTTYDLRVDG